MRMAYADPAQQGRLMTRPFRRMTLYLPGFDPFPARRYREIYRREAAAQSAISGYRIQIARDSGAGGAAWTTRAEFPEGAADGRVEVLVWHDLVRASMQHGILATYLQLLRTAWVYLGSGAFFRMMRFRRGPVLAGLYPVLMLLAQLMIALGLAILAAHALPGWIGLATGIITLTVVLALFRAADRWLYAYYLMHDYAFSARCGGAYPPQLEARLASLTDRLAEALAGDNDEVLLVGHSSGACLAVSIMADLIRAGRAPAQRPALALLTLGQVVPMLSFLPRADRLRADLAFLSEQPGIFWLDVSAPGDACSFALCDPVAISGVAGPGQRWPLVISAAFSLTLSPGRWRAMRHRWLRRHFQYLHAFDQPGDYDYFAITAGPVTLAHRFATRAPSPGLIREAAR